MKVTIHDGCIACGLCASICPSVFHMTDENLAEVSASPAPSEEAATQEAAECCPVSVIITED